MPRPPIAHFEGIYEETESHPNSDYVFSELIETRSKNFNWVIEPHVHQNLFQIFLLATGEVKLQQSSQNLLLKAPCIIIIPQANLHGFSYSLDVTGRILSLSGSVIDKLFSNDSIIQTALNSNIQIIQVFEEEITFGSLIEQIQKIDNELFNDHSEKQAMLHSHITQVIISLYRLLKSNEILKNAEGNIQLTYFRKFQKSIKNSHYPKSIGEFAAELSISTVHLNRICKEVLGKNALQMIQDFMIEEAKKYLVFTSYSVSEIAYLLKFEYPNYFAKSFKKSTGMSPREFRESKNSN